MDPACGTGGFLVYAMRHSIDILSKKFDDGLISGYGNDSCLCRARHDAERF
jgi:hypothetical protein